MNDRLIDEIPIDCPYCNKEFSIPIESIGDSVTCPYCNETFDTEDNGFLDATESIEEKINDLLDNLL